MDEARGGAWPRWDTGIVTLGRGTVHVLPVYSWHRLHLLQSAFICHLCQVIGSLLSFLEIKFCTQFCKKISNSNTKSLRLSPFNNWRPLLGEIKKPWSGSADGHW